jgi:general secretion pathway protein N
MLRWFLYISIGLIIYLVFLIFTLPAHLALNWAPMPVDIQIRRPVGTLWQGSLEQLKFGDVTLNQVDWDLAFWPLLTGKVSVDARFGTMTGSTLTGQGKLGYAWGKSSAEGLVVELPAQQVMKLLDMNLPLSAHGDVRVVIDNFFQGSPWCQILAGRVDWSGAGVSGPLLPEPLELGVLSGMLSCEQGGLVLSVDDSNSPLGLKGTLSLLERGRYQINTLLRPDAELPDPVRDGIILFSRQTSEGYLLEMDGRF